MNNDILAHIQEHLINKIQSTTDVKELIQIWMLWDNLQRPVQLTARLIPAVKENC